MVLWRAIVGWASHHQSELLGPVGNWSESGQVPYGHVIDEHNLFSFCKYGHQRGRGFLGILSFACALGDDRAFDQVSGFVRVMASHLDGLKLLGCEF